MICREEFSQVLTVVLGHRLCMLIVQMGKMKESQWAICLLPHLHRRSKLGFEPRSVSVSPRSTFHAVWVSRVKLGRTFEAKQFSESDHITWMISLCLSTHPSEEASSPDHWFSNMIGHQAHSQMDYKDRFLAPSTTCSCRLQEGEAQESIIWTAHIGILL